MNISKKWLSDYVAVNCDDATLCHKLTMAGIEVEKVETASTVPAGVVAAKIMSRDVHPNSDHLSVCQVFNGKETIQIVCGAPNCDAGKIVPLAQIGTVFSTPEGEFKIKKSKLRGVESNGMMCSEEELGLGSDNSGLMILDDSIAPGTPFEELYPGDTFMELEVTPNRPDWLSVWGIARDVSCLLGTEAKLPEISITESNDAPRADLVTVEASDLCHRYIGRVIRDVKVGPSPAWLVERLESVGLRSINNIVDVTNFVLMELGQPLHAFDLDKLEEGRVVARRAVAGEKIITLDGSELELDENCLVIADAKKPMALAGVMGGEFSGVTETTTSILLESAVFQPSNIRATSRRLGISSDSSYRFERGVDYDMAELASVRAVQLILEVAGGKLEGKALDINTGRPQEAVIPCKFENIRTRIGSGVTNERIEEIFRTLHLGVSDVTSEGCVVTAPLFRRDLLREADLVEEVARIDGLDKIPEIAVAGKCCHPQSEDAWMPLQKLRHLAAGLGFYECVHYSIGSVANFLSDSRFSEDDLVKLDNPLSPEMSVMRPSLLGGLLGAVERNIARGNRTLALFELDRCFCANAQKFPEERNELAFVLTGLRHPERFSAELKENYDFYDLKGALESLFELLNITNYRFALLENDDRFRAGHACAIVLEGKTAGAFGELNKKFTSNWRTVYPVFAAQIEVAAILQAASRGVAKYKAAPQYPATSRDIAFVASADLSCGDIIDFIRRKKLQNLESVQLFDIFEDDALKAKQQKSMAFSLTFRNSERTLKDDEVNAAVEKLRNALANELKVELR